MKSAQRNIVGPIVLLILNGALMLLSVAAIYQYVLHIQSSGGVAERFMLAGGALCALIGAAAAYALLGDTQSARPLLLRRVSELMAVAAILLLLFSQFA